MNRLLLAGVLVSIAAFACSAESRRKRPEVQLPESSDDFYGDDELPPARTPDQIDDAGGIFNVPERQKDGGTPDARPVESDAAVVVDASAPHCTDPPMPGDLLVVELMISSQSGSGDDGEWLEVQNRTDCALNLQGLRIESPRGTTDTNAVTIRNETWLQPKQSFLVVSNSAAIAKQHLPGVVFAWGATDVLKNSGDTVRIVRDIVTVDELTYPNVTPTPGRSISFPSDCVPEDRSSFIRWSLSFTEYTAGYKGTPNAENGDVTCQ